MSLTHTLIPSIICSCIILILAILLIIYLLKHADVYPYKVLPTQWTIFAIISIIISQLYSSITISFDNQEYYQIIQIVFISNIKLLCFAMRCFTLRKMVSYNSSHLKQKFFAKNYSLKQRFFKRKYRYHKAFICFSIFLFLTTFAFLGISQLRNEMKQYLSSLYNYPSEIQSYLEVWCLCSKAVIYIIFVSYSYFALTIFKFKLTRDYFKIKTEILLTLLIAFTFTNIPEIVLFIYLQAVPSYWLILYESIYNGGILLLYGTLIIIRYNAFRSFSVDNLLYSFEKICSCTATFKLFADYIKIFKETSYKILLFWIDYMVLADELKKYQKDLKPEETDLSKSNYASELFIPQHQYMISESEKQLKRKATKLFKDYVSVNNSQDDCYSRTDEDYIEFPIDISDKIEKILNDKFDFNINELGSAFAEAFDWICYQLEKEFKTYINDEEEKAQIKRIIFSLHCFEIMDLNENNLLPLK